MTAFQNNRQGSSLLVVLAILAILGIMVSVSLQYSGRSLNYAVTQRNSSVERIGLLSAMDFARYRTDKDSIPFRNDSLIHFPPDTSLSYEISSRQCGILAILRVIANVRNRNSDTVYLSPTTTLPTSTALIILDPRAVISLSNQTAFQGNISIRNGKVLKSNSSFIGSILDSASFPFQDISIDPRPIGHWIESVAQLSLFNHNDTTIVQQIDTNSTQLIRYPGTAIFRGNLLVSNRLIVADRIVIDDSISLQNSILCARSIRIRTKGFVGGQFIALDTLEFESGIPKDDPFFYVHGSAYSGLLHVRKFTGSGTFLFAGNQWTEDDSRLKLKIDPGCNITGFVGARGWADLTGSTIQGSVLVWNILTQDGPTQYLGDLRRATISAALQKPRIPDIIRSGIGVTFTALHNPNLWVFHD